jgi:hypothetical protein
MGEAAAWCAQIVSGWLQWTVLRPFGPWPLGSGPIWGPHWLHAWGTGAVIAIVLAVALIGRDRPPGRVVRGLAGTIALASALVAALLAFAPRHVPASARPVNLVLSLLGAVVAAAVALALVRPAFVSARTRTRIAAVSATVGAFVALGWPTLREAWDEYRPQGIAPVRLELVAAYVYEPEATGAVVVDPTRTVGDLVSSRGARFNLHRGDQLAIDPAEIRRVRWIERPGEPAAIVIRVDADARARIDRRSIERASQYDAVLVDGKLATILLYEQPGIGRLILWDPDRAALADLYRRLTGTDP